MSEIVDGLGSDTRERIAALRGEGRFFWIDTAAADIRSRELEEALSIPEHALVPLLDFDESTPPSRKFHADGDHVVFTMSCFLPGGGAEDGDGVRQLLPVEVHVLVHGDYLLTVHRERLSLPQSLASYTPEGRSEQYVVYAVLDAMVATGFDALNDAELTLEGLQMLSTNMRGARVRMATLRKTNGDLSAMRRRVGPQRGIFERISEEIGRVKGLQSDSEQLLRADLRAAEQAGRRDRRRLGLDGEADRPAPQRDHVLADGGGDDLPAADLRHRLLRDELRLDDQADRHRRGLRPAGHRGAGRSARPSPGWRSSAAAPRSSPIRTR